MGHKGGHHWSHFCRQWQAGRVGDCVACQTCGSLVEMQRAETKKEQQPAEEVSMTEIAAVGLDAAKDWCRLNRAGMYVFVDVHKGTKQRGKQPPRTRAKVDCNRCGKKGFVCSGGVSPPKARNGGPGRAKSGAEGRGLGPGLGVGAWGRGLGPGLGAGARGRGSGQGPKGPAVTEARGPGAEARQGPGAQVGASGEPPVPGARRFITSTATRVGTSMGTVHRCKGAQSAPAPESWIQILLELWNGWSPKRPAAACPAE